MSKPTATVTALLMLTAILAAGPVWSRTDGKICELSHIERDKVDSARCIACHDGSVTSAVPYTYHASGDLSGLQFDDRGGSHPIEFDYGSASLRRPTRLAPIDQLNPVLVLSGGKVTCATCHDGQSPHPFHTAVRMDGSAMCFACHAGY
ncbi:MAG: cytochrome c3 family protein [Myxococcaceae bacterium]